MMGVYSLMCDEREGGMFYQPTSPEYTDTCYLDIGLLIIITFNWSYHDRLTTLTTGYLTSKSCGFKVPSEHSVTVAQ